VSKQAVLVIGDVMLDERVEGDMTRISPEAPSPVVCVTDTHYTLGGAGNVAANIASLGRKVYLLGAIGPDQNGQVVTQLAGELGLLVNFGGIARTTTKTRVTCGGQQVLRTDREGIVDTANHIDHVKAAIAGINSSEIGIIVIADYAKGMINGPIVDAINDFAVKHHIPIYVDGKPQNYVHYWGKVDLVKPNLVEAEEIMDMAGEVLHPARQIGTPLDRARLAAKAVAGFTKAYTTIVTAGASGAACATIEEGDERYTQFTRTPDPQECFDPTGCGDTFMAVLVDAYLTGFGIETAVDMANTGAALAASKHGTYVITRDDLEDAGMARLGVYGKIMTIDQLALYLTRKRANGDSIVMTNGTFRYLHHGHMETIRWAKKRGDRLIVAMNSDEAIEELKPGKSYIPAKYRLQMMAQMPEVDAVWLFNDADVTATVKAINPNILVKGAEYRDKMVPGADFVAKNGGEVLFSPMIDGFHADDLT